jgi:hypothetical protein
MLVAKGNYEAGFSPYYVRVGLDKDCRKSLTEQIKSMANIKMAEWKQMSLLLIRPHNPIYSFLCYKEMMKGPGVWREPQLSFQEWVMKSNGRSPSIITYQVLSNASSRNPESSLRGRTWQRDDKFRGRTQLLYSRVLVHGSSPRNTQK